MLHLTPIVPTCETVTRWIALTDRVGHGILLEKHYLLIDYFWKIDRFPSQGIAEELSDG
jgi:hypothetical protein